MNFNTLIRIPKVQLSLYLGLIYLCTLIHTPSLPILMNIVLALTSAILFDLLFLKIRKKTFFFPHAAVVSALIIALLSAPTLPMYEVILSAGIAMFFKNFVKITSRHVFNPAAIGLFITSLLFGHIVSWWGVSWQQIKTDDLFVLISFIVLLLPGLVSVVRMKRWRIPLTFLLVYVLLNALILSNFDILASRFLILNSLLDPTTLFFSLVMLPEPMTTPNKPWRQVIFGLCIAILCIVLSNQIFGFIPDVLIGALLIGNIAFIRFK